MATMDMKTLDLEVRVSAKKIMKMCGGSSNLVLEEMIMQEMMGSFARVLDKQKVLRNK